MDYKVVLTSRAERDLFAAVTFLAEKNPAAAQRAGNSLLDAAESLRLLPFRGPMMKNRTDLRKLSHPPYYLIVYRVNESARLVAIIRFWDARRNPGQLHLP